jgi:hypothetical protein
LLKTNKFMTHHFTRILIFALSIVLTSCVLNLFKDEKKTAKAELETVTINENYSMGIPKFMTKATGLNDEASLQYQNIFKETYVIVIDENKQEFIDAYQQLQGYDSSTSVISSYADTQVQLTTSSMNVLAKSEVKFFPLNGLNAANIEIDAELEGIKTPITYFLTFVEGDESLYFVMAWTLQKYKDDYRETFAEMAKTFKTTATAPVAVN